MPRPRALRPFLLRFCLLLMIGLLVASPVSAQESGAKPRLSDALRAALAKEPPDSVEKRFSAALKSGTPAYEFDAAGVQALGVEYMQAGEMANGTVVMTIAAQAMQSMMADMMPDAAKAAAATEETRRRDREARAAAPSEEEQARQRSLARLGPPRDDLDRFHGIFGEPGGRSDRTLFLVRNCDGHLVIGATWGDVAPWPMRSLGDTTFEWPGDNFTDPVRVEIVTGADGKATRISHGWTFVTSPLVRTGDLPADWEPVCGTGG